MTRPVHVLFVPAWYPTEETPSNGIFILEQIAALGDLDVKADVLYPDLLSLRRFGLHSMFRRRFQTVQESDGRATVLRTLGWNVFGRLGLGGVLWVELAKRLARRYVAQFGRPDLIHAHTAIWGGMAGMHIAREFNLPLVITEHSSAYIEGLATSFQMRETKNAYAAAECVISVSDYAAKNLVELELVNPDRLRVIPNIGYTQLFVLPGKRPPGKIFRFLAVARLEQRKQVGLLISAFAEAFPEPDVILEIGGDGPERAKLERLIEECHLVGRVHLLGNLSREQVRDAMWRANAFVHNSLVETFGLVIVEAMATGLPILSTACGGPDSIVTSEVGRLVPVGDRAALVKGLRWMSECAKNFSGESVRQHVVERYSAPVVARQIIDVYRQALESGSRAFVGKA